MVNLAITSHISSINSPNGPYSVFISHAGEDKIAIAIPLRHRLSQLGITAFVDKEDMPPGTEATPAIIHAMQTANIGVFVLSPEFVARKWPMKELMHFLSRYDRCVMAGTKAPKIIPLFYRLAISELYDERRLDRNDKDDNNLYEMSRFYERQKKGEPEANIASIKAALRRLHDFMGIENAVNANNDSSYDMKVVREMLLDTLSKRVCQAMSGRRFENDVTGCESETLCEPFRPNFDVPSDVSELIFYFERKDSTGIACTQEGKILKMLLDTSMYRNRAIAIRGIGGVGKTSLLRKIRSLNRVFERFQDGVYHMEVGRDTTKRRLQEMLAAMVFKSGGKRIATSMGTETDMRNVIEAFRSWFANKQCLFVIDDVWDTKELTPACIRDLWNLHTSGRDSKTVLTTRSKEISADVKAYFFLEPREPLEEHSRAILYHYSGLKPMRGQLEDNRAVEEILQRCAGLPLFLGVAGKGVKTLSFRRGHKGCMTYRLYAKHLETSMGHMVLQKWDRMRDYAHG